MKTIKRFWVLPILALSLFFTACGMTTSESTTSAETQTSSESVSDKKEFTVAELAEFDGKDGRPAYVAVDGVVYDVTDSKAWKDGAHYGFEAGKDLTDGIKNDSPHGVSKLGNVPEIGTLIP